MMTILIIFSMSIYLPFYINSVPVPDNFYVSDFIRAQFIIKYGHDITQLNLTSTIYFSYDFWMRHNLDVLDSKPFATYYLSILHVITNIELNYFIHIPFIQLLGVIYIYIIFSKIIISRISKFVYFLIILIPVLSYSIYMNIMYYRSFGFLLLFLFLINFVMFVTNYSFRKQTVVILILVFLATNYTYYSASYYIIFALILFVILNYFIKITQGNHIKKDTTILIFALLIILIISDTVYYNVIKNLDLNNIILSFKKYIDKVYTLIFNNFNDIESPIETSGIVYGKYVMFTTLFDLINRILTISIMSFFIFHKYLRSFMFKSPYFISLLSFFSSIGILYSLGYSAIGYIASSIPALLLFVAPLLMVSVLNFLEVKKSLPLLIIWVFSFLVGRILYYSDPLNPFSYSSRYIIVYDCLDFPVEFLKPSFVLVSTHTCTAHISWLMAQLLHLDTATTLIPFLPKHSHTLNTVIYISLIYNNSNIDFAGWNIKYIEGIIDLLLDNRNIVYHGMNGILVV